MLQVLAKGAINSSDACYMRSFQELEGDWDSKVDVEVVFAVVPTDKLLALVARLTVAPVVPSTVKLE